MGALRGLPLDVGRKRAEILLTENGLGDYVDKPIKSLSKGMAQTIQLFGTIVHQPKLVVLDEPFSGLDAINQGRLEQLIREEAAAGTTVIFSTHVIHHAERLCERIAIIAGGEVRFEGLVADGARPAAAAGAAEDARRRRAVAAGAARRCGADATACGISNCPRTASSRCSARCSTARPGSRSWRSSGAACTTPSSPSPAKPRPARWATPTSRRWRRRHDRRARSGLGDRPARFRRHRLFAQLHPVPDRARCCCSRR